MTELLTKKAAAEELAVSVRTVDTYIQQGMLTKFKKGGRTYVPASELQELKRDRQEGTGALLKRGVIADLRRRVGKLEQKVSLLLNIHEHADPPFDLGEKEAATMYAAATHAVTHLSVEEAQRWVTMLPRVDETTLLIIKKATGHSNAGALMLALCMKLQQHLKEQPHYGTTLDLQKLHYQLESCRRHMRATLVVYLELLRGTPLDGALDPLSEAGMDALADIVDACRKNEG